MLRNKTVPFLLSFICLLLVSAVLVTSCSKGPIGSKRSIAGTYKMVEGPVDDATVTFGKDTFVFSSGAYGTYEVEGDTVILISDSFGGVAMKIQGNALVGGGLRLEKMK